MHLAVPTLQDLNYEAPIQPRLQAVGRNVSLSKLVFLSICVVWLALRRVSHSIVGLLLRAAAVQ